MSDGVPVKMSHSRATLQLPQTICEAKADFTINIVALDYRTCMSTDKTSGLAPIILLFL